MNSLTSNNNKRKRLVRDPTSSNNNSNGATLGGRLARKRNGGDNSKNNNQNNNDTTTCSFCLQVPAAISVDIPVLGRRNKRAPTPYCLTCYYTSAVVRFDLKYIQIINKAQLQEQLPPMQDMFNEVYLEIQKELTEEAERSFRQMKKDPLAAMMNLHHHHHAPSKHRMKKTAGNVTDGGFLQRVAAPAKFLQTQKQQAFSHEALIQRMNQAAAAGTVVEGGGRTSSSSIGGGTNDSHIFKRRKSSRKSIWNLAMDPNSKNNYDDDDEGKKNAAAAGIDLYQDNDIDLYGSTCSCGSTDVNNMGSMTSRNQDMRKGETWGMKDRGGEVMTRYQCNKCGKTWNEEE